MPHPARPGPPRDRVPHSDRRQLKRRRRRVLTHRVWGSFCAVGLLFWLIRIPVSMADDDASQWETFAAVGLSLLFASQVARSRQVLLSSGRKRPRSTARTR